MPRSKKRLLEILAGLNPELIWRPVLDENGSVLAKAWGERGEEPPPSLEGVDFKGRRIADLGCNLGYFSFEAARLGAASVLGIDIYDDIIEACLILKEMRRAEKVSFMAADFTKLETQPFDIAMMIDVIGNNKIRKGSVLGFSKVLERFAGQSMVLSLRPVCDPQAHLNAPLEDLRGKYPEKYLENGRLRLLDYIMDNFERSWTVRYLSPFPDEPERKHLVHLVRA